MGSLYGASLEVLSRRRIDGARGRRFVVSIKLVGVRHRKSIVARRDVRSPPCSSPSAKALRCSGPGMCDGRASRYWGVPSRLKWAGRSRPC